MTISESILQVNDVSRLTSQFLDPMSLHSILWSIEAKKIFVYSEPYLCFYLRCLRNLTTNWSCAASCVVNILAFEGNGDIEIGAKPYVFDDNHLKNDLFGLVKWDDLLDERNGYVRNDVMNWNIKLEVDNFGPDRSVLDFYFREENCFCISTFKLKISKVTNLMAVKSEYFRIADDENFLLVYKHNGYLGVCLQKDYGVTLLKTHTMFVKLISTKKDQISKAKPYELSETARLVSWNALLKEENGFIKDDSIEIDVIFVSASKLFQTDIELAIANANNSERNPMTIKGTSLSLKENYVRFYATIENIESLEAVKTKVLNIEDEEWSFIVYKYNGHLGIGFQFYGDASFTRTIVVKILSQQKSVVQKRKLWFLSSENVYARELVPWDEILKPENFFIRNDSLTLEITLEAAK